MTEQQLVGGRENPLKPDSIHRLIQLSFWQGTDPAYWDPELGPVTLSPFWCAYPIGALG